MDFEHLRVPSTVLTFVLLFLFLLLVLLLTPLGPTLEPTWRFLGLQSPRLQHLEPEMPWRKGGRAAVVPPWGSQSAAQPPKEVGHGVSNHGPRFLSCQHIYA